MNIEINKISEKLKSTRLENEYSLYFASQFCDMGSHSGLQNLENGGDCKISTLLKISKNLKINLKIENGKIEIL